MDGKRQQKHKSQTYELEMYKNPCDSLCRKQVAKRVLMSVCGRTMELKSLPTIKEIVEKRVLVSVWRKNDGVEIIANDQGNRREKSSYVCVKKNDGVEIIDNDQGNRREKSSCVGMRKKNGVEITANDQENRRCCDADVTPIVRDLLDDDRIPVQEQRSLLFHESLPIPII